MKRTVFILILAVILFTASACQSSAPAPFEAQPAPTEAALSDAAAAEEAPAAAAAVPAQETAETEKVIAYFMELANVPRPSHHEEQIIEFMIDWFAQMGYAAARDEAGNITADLPATAGYDSLPLLVLQGHMDMVCVAAEGVTYDPLTDPIKVINDGVTLTADGTTLGADNGIGLALIMYIADPANKVEHGPLRCILTVNEEDGSTGVAALDPTCVADAKYLLNIDSEESGVITNSTAGYVAIDVTANPETTTPSHKTAFKLGVSGLLGGHSGMEINTGHINAIKVVAGMLAEMTAKGIDFELASFTGGTARNAIPTSAEAVLVTDADSEKAVVEIAAASEADYKASFATTDPDIAITVENADLPDVVFTTGLCKRIVDFAMAVPSGVQSMSMKVEGLVESSSNLGVVSATPEGVLFSNYPRSSEKKLIENTALSIQALADACGMQYEMLSSAPPWPVNPDSALVPLISEIYKEQTGNEARLQAVHAGLECGTFASYNTELDIASIGPDITGAHTPEETLQIASVGEMLAQLKAIILRVQ